MASLQEGIYFDQGQTPGRCFALLFLRAREDATASDVGTLLQKLWRLYQSLKAGNVPDLPGVPLPPSGLTVLIGYGPKAFKLAGAMRPLPQLLRPANQFRSSAPGGGNPILVGSKLRYATGLLRNMASEEIAVQFIGDTPLAVNRPVVETWKLLHDHRDPTTGQAALSIAEVFTGFNREDHRSWIDFHDGVSNLKSGEQRRLVIEIRDIAGGDNWVIGGTCMSFLRIAVDLTQWRRFTRAEQELLVGRDKLTGCPLEVVDTDGTVRPVGGCPVAGSLDVSDRRNDTFREPRQGASPPLDMSHVRRANQIVDVGDPQGARIFRQGYEFLNGLDGGGIPFLGLNFVSYQDSPARVVAILTRPQWLREVNFGGDPVGNSPVPPELLSVHAAGMFLVPPVVPEEDFPGSTIFVSSPHP